MRGATFWHSLRFVIPGAGVGLLMVGDWTWYAVPPPTSCSGSLVCTQVFIPGGPLAALFLVTGGFLTVGWGFGVGLHFLLQRLVQHPVRESVARH